MNNNRAIELFRSFLGDGQYIFEHKWTLAQMQDACRDAIKALEQTEVEGDLISREELKVAISREKEEIHTLEKVLNLIDNAPTVEVPEEVNCVLTMFGKCSYNETGCSDCEIKKQNTQGVKRKYSSKGGWLKWL